MTPQLRVWRWKQLPAYNGFTHEERVRGWQVMWWMIDKAQIEKPATCAITGRTGSVSLHSENYYDWAPIGVCHDVHLALHRRFRKPHDWQRIVGKYAVTGEEWFAKLSSKPIDLAAQLRNLHGAGISDVFARAGVPVSDQVGNS